MQHYERRSKKKRTGRNEKKWMEKVVKLPEG